MVGIKDRGFTLIEMMIVVVLIGILSAVLFPDYQSYIRTGQSVEAEKTASWIAQNVIAYIQGHPLVSETDLENALSPEDRGNLNGDDPTKEISTLIPGLQNSEASPNQTNFIYTVDTVIPADRKGRVCVKAISRKDPEAIILYSSSPSYKVEWEGNIFRKRYIDKTVALVAGGWCTAEGAAADEWQN